MSPATWWRSTMSCAVAGLIFAPGGWKPKRHFSTSCNITERRKAEEGLQLSEARKGAMLATALDAIVSIDHEGKAQEWNPAMPGDYGLRHARLQELAATDHLPWLDEVRRHH